MPFQAFKIDRYFITFWIYRPVRDAKCPVRDTFSQKPLNIFEKFLLDKLNNKITVGNKSYGNAKVYRSQPDCKTIGCVQLNANYPAEVPVLKSCFQATRGCCLKATNTKSQLSNQVSIENNRNMYFGNNHVTRYGNIFSFEYFKLYF